MDVDHVKLNFIESEVSKMPYKDGTGPNGQGPRTGRGMGPCGGGMGYGRGCYGCTYCGRGSRMTKEDEKEYLEAEKIDIQKELEAIDERLEELSK